jgi:purine-binding chemotaxis protein CheW
VAEEAFEEPPETLHGITRELIRGAYKLDQALLLLLDVQGAVDLPPSPAGGSGISGAAPM